MSNNRAQVGIGTLIVFIAMVLVAAIAAGVLVDTAGFLQNKAQDSGEDSTQKVTDRIDIVESYGTVAHLEPDDGTNETTAPTKYYVANGSDATGDAAANGGDALYAVDTLDFVIMKSAGSGDIEVDSVVMMWQGPSGAEEMTLDNDTYDRITHTDITGAGDDVLNEQSDRMRLSIDLDPYKDGTTADTTPVTDDYKDTNFDVLQGGEEVTIKFTTTSGATIRKTITMPTTYAQDDGTIIDL